MNSISTVAKDISNDFKQMSKDGFIKKYYHLRPGSYDITSLRYESNLIKNELKLSVIRFLIFHFTVTYLSGLSRLSEFGNLAFPLKKNVNRYSLNYQQEGLKSPVFFYPLFLYE